VGSVAPNPSIRTRNADRWSLAPGRVTCGGVHDPDTLGGGGPVPVSLHVLPVPILAVPVIDVPVIRVGGPYVIDGPRFVT